MRVTKRQLRRIISESLGLKFEQAEPSIKQEKTLIVKTTGEKASDNSKALIVDQDSEGVSVFKHLIKTLGSKYSGEYYVWSGSKRISDDSTYYEVGEYYKKSGDPYTYQLIGKGKTKDGKEGNNYRVISGPKHSRAGARPIGATFVYTKDDIIPTPKPTPPQTSKREFPINATQVDLLTNSYKQALAEAQKAEKDFNSLSGIQKGNFQQYTVIFTGAQGGTKLTDSIQELINDCNALQQEIKGALSDNGNNGSVSGEDFDYLESVLDDILKKHASIVSPTQKVKPKAGIKQLDSFLNKKFKYSKGILDQFFSIGETLFSGGTDAELPSGTMGDNIQILRNNFSDPKAANQMIGRGKGGREQDV